MKIVKIVIAGWAVIIIMMGIMLIIQLLTVH